MMRIKQEAPRTRLLLLLLICFHGLFVSAVEEKKLHGDKCRADEECFEGAHCDSNISWTCLCRPEFPVSNHLDKCGIAAKLNESCFFKEQCENINYKTTCLDGVCVCKREWGYPALKDDGHYDCVEGKTSTPPGTYIDPAMIGILVAMFLMFITICVVLRLFSKARWGENRTIFNTPNPRLMNASLLRENKLLHQERRGSKVSQPPSRPSSVTSLQPHSPNSQGSRKGSPTDMVVKPMLENTIEIEHEKRRQNNY